MDIVYSSTKLLNIKLLTVVNRNAWYEIDTKDKELSFKPKFVCVPQSTIFIALKHNGNIHVFNLIQDTVFPDEFKTYLREINDKLMKYFNDSTSSVRISDEINRPDNPHHFVVVRPNLPRTVDEFINLDDAKRVIQSLNSELQKKCPGFHLQIDYITSFPVGSTVSLYSGVLLNAYIKPPLLLCLMHGNECVSSITLMVSEREPIIESKTNKRYEGRKFNTLLRAVAIMISKSLYQNAEYLISNAVNIISATLMIKRFNASATFIFPNTVRVISKTSIKPEKFNKTIEDFFDYYGSMQTRVDLNEENIVNATSVFHETIQRMNCEPLAGGMKRTKRIRKPKKIRRSRRKISH